MPTLLGSTLTASKETTSNTTDKINDIAVGTAGNRCLIIFTVTEVQAKTANDWGWIGPRVDTSEGPLGNTQIGRVESNQAAGGADNAGGGFAYTAAPDTDIHLSHDVDLTGELHIRNAQLSVWDIEDIYADATQFVEDTDTVGGTSTTSYVEKASVEVTPNETGEKWLILGSYSATLIANGLLGTKISNTGGDLAEVTYSKNSGTGSATDYAQLCGYVWTAPDTSAETFSLSADSNGTSSTYLGGSLIAVRLTSLSANFASVVDVTRYETASALAEELITGSDTVLTPSGDNDVWLLGLGYHDLVAGGGTANLWWSADSNTSTIPATLTQAAPGYTGNNAADIPAVMAMGLVTAPTGEQTYQLYSVASDAADAFEISMALALEVDGGSTPAQSSVSLQGDVSPQYIAALAAAAAVTPTSGEIVGKLNEIGGTSGLELEAAKAAAETAAGL